MCFGSKASAGEGSAAPRPVSLSSTSGKKQSAAWSAPSQSQPEPQSLFQDDYAAPSGPPPGHMARPVHNVASDDYAPPPGAPPSYGSDYAPPSGPPPSHAADGYAPPSGPPPSHSGGDYAPPPGPPPGQHDWQSAVPDTALLPPPPSLFSGWDRSPASNAPEEQSIAGEQWCRDFPLQSPPMDLRDNEMTRRVIASCATTLQRPPMFRGKLQQEVHGTWSIESAHKCPDACLIGFPPSYAPSLHSPVHTGRPFTMYYEVYVQSCKSEVTLAMGFTAMPYPPFRMPGWHRGSLALHGDDGHRYINDTWGGKTLREGFVMKPGGTYGIGMQFTRKGRDDIDVKVFVTVDGKAFEEWDIHEETDAEQDRPVTGLEGYHDLSIAVGVFDENTNLFALMPLHVLYATR
ncbi:spry domain-containing protein [Ophiostoma piceae UAMH 11346]|uniref:Spry domain-containing protein n=1 Tax=Ophiostoma piceae (strain UAMH 11346) TaxID=1262450 RepID=S3CSG7_OPHP1|nr:spry domain-containing protein [Ophiostoma piceae UAMH 11346]